VLTTFSDANHPPPLGLIHVFVTTSARAAIPIAAMQATKANLLIFCTPSLRRAPLTRRAGITFLQFYVRLSYHIPAISRNPKFGIIQVSGVSAFFILALWDWKQPEQLVKTTL
jgi:hypothetical protein